MIFKVANSERARRHLEGINASSYPHAKVEWQKSHHKEVYKAAYPYSEGKEMSVDEFAAMLSGRGR